MPEVGSTVVSAPTLPASSKTMPMTELLTAT